MPALNRIEFPYRTIIKIHPLETRLFFTFAPGLYFAGGISSILEYTSGYCLKKKSLTSGFKKSIFVL